MLEVFTNDDRGYLRWAMRNPRGFIVNADHDRVSPDYPMIHRATHRALTSPKKENYTTRRFFKVCSDKRNELERWARGREESHYSLVAFVCEFLLSHSTCSKSETPTIRTVHNRHALDQERKDFSFSFSHLLFFGLYS